MFITLKEEGTRDDLSKQCLPLGKYLGEKTEYASHLSYVRLANYLYAFTDGAAMSVSHPCNTLLARGLLRTLQVYTPGRSRSPASATVPTIGGRESVWFT